MVEQSPLNMQFPNDETIFSIVARYAILGAFRRNGVALKDIFNNSRKRIHPYLPGYINKVAIFFDLSPEELLLNHTLYPLFAWSNKSTSNNLKSAMLSACDDKSTFIAGLPQSKYRFYYGLKYCPKCVEEDVKTWGFKYWHMTHQIPGVDSCHKHPCALLGVQSGDGQKDRTLILPPSNAHISGVNSAQLRFSNFANELFEASKYKQFDCHIAYKNALDEKGYITKSKHVRLKELISEVKQYWEELLFDSPLSVPKSLSNFEFLGPMLRDSSVWHYHPIKHILFACWLFDGDVDAFVKYSHTNKIAIDPVRIPPPVDKSRDDVLELLNESLSMNTIEQITGKSRCCIRRIAELNNVGHKTNANSYSKLTREMVLNLALLGRHRAFIAKFCNVGLGYVEQVISNTRGLVLWRKRLRKKIKVNKAKKVINEVVSIHPEWLRKDIKEACSREFFCLYHHDKKALEEILPTKHLATFNGRNWSEEDVRMSAEINALKDATSMSLRKIDRIINGHGRLQNRIDQFPVTKSALVKLGKLKE
tara:strand:- start:1454 stop:3058 length:1605 start_codon:yes stop_codon:yes gene_type:complete